MCDPMTVMTVASTAIGFISDAQAAEDYEQELADNYRQQQEDYDALQRELNENAANEKSDIVRESLIKMGQVRVASGENLGRGVVVDLLQQDVKTQEGFEITRVESERVRKLKQVGRERESSRAKAQSSINRVAEPSILEAGLQIAGATHSGLEAKKKKKTDGDD